MSDQNKLSEYLPYLSLGLEIAAALAFPILLGFWLDSYLGWQPWLLLTGCLVGIVNIFLLIFRLNERLNQD
ncbi:Putative F0F1-ATPase subunit Ca2+/Mg2+ transporter [Fodinibius roseus]|uniref:Putative F0F1-ATPase subunit Ca2+/Mg2+ transporter n=1 Tax=Fodinibius roseus TaxID=1194090 RepID=A0A1M4T630_9BACT|nr:AtpZ/AtpI family protein [Fodinibius roseus]SHE39860.1 Putative F0F1-ATPase subunit Ca2+/Mg2+ transporter [Fodinibius roseus]